MLRIGSSKMLDPTLSTSPEIFLHEMLKNMTLVDYNSCCNDFSRLKSWDVASMLGLADMSGTWDLGPHANWS